MPKSVVAGSLTKVGIEGTYLNIVKTIYDKLKCNTQWRIAESLPTKIWSKTRMPALTIVIQHSTGSPSHSNQTKKKLLLKYNYLTYTPIFIEALFTIAKAWKQPECSLKGGLDKDVISIYNGILLSHKIE